jgi:hypothetical protein
MSLAMRASVLRSQAKREKLYGTKSKEIGPS